MNDRIGRGKFHELAEGQKWELVPDLDAIARSEVPLMEYRGIKAYWVGDQQRLCLVWEDPMSPMNVVAYMTHYDDLNYLPESLSGLLITV